jgi:hypothetical protein
VLVRWIAACAAVATAAAAVAIGAGAVAPPRTARALVPLPEYVCWLAGGAVHRALPFSAEATPALVEPAVIPPGSASGLEPPIRLVAFSWAPDGTYVSLLAQSGATGAYREFMFDTRSGDVTATAAASAAKPARFLGSGGVVDPSPEALAKSPDGKMTALIKPDGPSRTPQVFLGIGTAAPVRIGPEEVRGRACSRVAFSPGSRYVAYEVAKPGSGSEVWITVVGGKQQSFRVSSDGARPAWQPYYRPGSTGASGSGATGTTSGGSSFGFCCGIPFAALALGLLGLVIARRPRR